MNVEKILTEMYWDELSPLSDDQIKYPDYDTLRKRLKKRLNSKYGIITAKEVNNEESKKHTFIFSEPVYVKEGEVIKEVNMAGILNAQVQEWYKNNVDLLSVIDKLTKRCEKLEEENTHLKDEVKASVSREEVTKKNLEWRTHEVTDLNNCLAQKNAKIKELRCKVTGNDLDIRAIYTSLGVDDIRSALDKIMEMKKLIKYVLEATHAHTIEEALNIFKNLPSWPITGMIDIRFYREAQDANKQLRKKVEELQESYDNCVNECSDHVIEINSLLQNLEVKTVEEALDKIRLIKRDGVFITMDFDSELRVENEKLKMKIEDLKKDVKFEFDHRMAVLAASVEQDSKIAELEDKLVSCKAENEKLKNFIKDRTKYLHDMTEAIEKHLSELRKEKNNEL